MSFDGSAIYALPPDSSGVQDWSITAAGTFTGAWITDLAGMSNVDCQMRFIYGSGGTSVRACLQSSLDYGVTAFDVAIVDFLLATSTALLEVAIQSAILLNASISDGGTLLGGGAATAGLKAGMLGDRLRMKIVVVGAYVNTTLAIRALPS
jgi:hypothetical protein